MTGEPPKCSCSCCAMSFAYTTGVMTPLRWVCLKHGDKIVGWIDPGDDKALCMLCVTSMWGFSREATP